MKPKTDTAVKKNSFKKHEEIKSLMVIDRCLEVKPQISIMIPTYKRPHLIKETIDSAVSQNSECSFEIVVVDNDSEKEFERELLDIINSYSGVNIRYFRNERNIGMFGNWNRCIELARGDFLTILNDDDLLHPEWLGSITNEQLRSTYNSGVLLRVKSERFTTTIPKFESVDGIIAKDIYYEDYFLGHQGNGSLGALFSRDLAIELGGFDESQFPVADHKFFMDYTLLHRAKRIERTLSYYRWGENESLNLTTLIGFIFETNRMLQEQMQNMNYPGWKVFVIRRAMDVIAAKKSYLYPRYNSGFSRSKALKGLNINRPLSLLYRLFPSKILSNLVRATKE